MKVAMIGAGSIVFAKTLLNDMLATPALQDAEYALMSRTEPKRRRMEAFAKRMVLEFLTLEIAYCPRSLTERIMAGRVQHAAGHRSLC